MYTLNIIKSIKKMNANNIRGFIYQNYHKRIGFSKEESSLKGLKKKDSCYLLTN